MGRRARLGALLASIWGWIGCEPTDDDPCQTPCPDRQEPVCGEDDVTYANACEAACAGQAYEPGPCSGGCSLEASPRLLHQTTGSSATVDATRTSSGTLLVWEETDESTARIFSLALDDGGQAISGPHLVQALEGSPAHPRVQPVQEDTFAVAWLQGTDPRSCGPLGVRLVDGGGVPLQDTVLAPASSSLACQPPSVVWTGERVLAVASEQQGDEVQPTAYVYSPEEGFEPEPIGLLDSTAAQSVRAVWSAQSAMMLVSRFEPSDDGGSAFLLRTDAKGTASSDTLLFSQPARFVEPAVLPDGTPVIVWDTREDDQTRPSLRLGFVRGSGLGRTVDVSDPEGGNIGHVSRLAVGTSGMAVAWSDDRTGTDQIRVSVTDLDGTGVTLDLLVSAEGRGAAIEPAIVPSGDGFLVMWRDTTERPGGDLYARRLECRW